MQRTIAVLLEYDGTHYAGWQRQPNTKTVQGEVERAVTECFGVPVRIVGSGRTDSGVHARGQVAHMLIEDGNAIPTNKIALAVNTHLPPDIRVRAAEDVDEAFHARHHANWREYSYTISDEHSVFYERFAWCPKKPYDHSLLAASAQAFVGEHDFTTFSKFRADCGTYVCDVMDCHVDETEGGSIVRIRANRFVYSMVRSVVGAMMDVAWQRRSIDDVRAALMAQDRSLSSQLAPPQGLCLTTVHYPNEIFHRYHPVQL